MKKMWEGRFSEASSELLEKFNASIEFDKNLYFEDITGSIAHATMLGECGIITKNDSKKIIKGLEQILKEFENGKFEIKISDEDIHMAVEKRLGEIIGAEFSGKLHTARSRNDQVATDFRRFVLRSNLEISKLLLNLITSFNEIAKANLNTLMPGYTHLQHAQPVSLAQHLMAYAFMFKRDFDRLISSYERNNFSPLGSAALAGTPHNINRNQTAELMGFKAPLSNSMDGVSDRDFALEILFNISVIFTHTSRLCEELILWSSQEFGFITISDKFSTGSSIMPQKKNPDVAELIRGKTGRVYGNLMALLTTMKALPLAYNKDMQEDKEGVFDSVEQAKNSLIILNEMLKTTKFNEENMLKATKTGHLSATDLADFLVRERNVPFRQAHFITGKCVARAEKLGIDLSEISLKELRKIYADFDESAIEVLNLANSKEARTSLGGTANASVKTQIKEIEKWLKSKA
ncbi:MULTISPECIES: argininosuccinate lyase [unclassified Campylobacter]|uniref:argininosuccinate lyase n=1 Tax=unclassified Campylobacter TaxID=2593542 RepID=UPI0022E9DCAE|nr:MULTISPECIES: argininosuccinate lyase [unclassified Campylobacter]MDA3056001.1 argininosuccinate lyase [Campylobacter sp. CN_NA1]MDA3065146.1 argininosuccinate lyase [Campylobacter sp. CN_NE4]MDA3067971.1 argininosuccinate lyase [Campylobacter sp. CN_NE3]MDA3082600.1 argininosuccinate lyase [Campylobacter sp. CN_EL2]MDA3083662.1 argininosuccinate lyase [Campylobacter sp. CN_NE1]